MVTIQRSNEEINSIGGISLIGILLNALESLKKVDNMRMKSIKKGKITHSNILLCLAGLFSLGRNEYADIELFRKDDFFRDSLKLKAVPSESTLRQRADELATVDEIFNHIKAALLELLKMVSSFGTEKVASGEYIPLDIDVSPFDNSDSHKEGVSWTYKNHDGYAPIFAYLGTEGYLLNCELRPGSQHSNKGALDFMRETLDMIEKLGVKLENILIRLDSAHDDDEIIEEITRRGAKIIIKRNLRKERKEWWLASARRVGTWVTPREGKNVFTGELSHIYPSGREDLAPIFATFEVIERTIDKHGQELLIPDIEVNTFWTNLSDESETVIRLYHNHGTSEQFHSELKTDLGIERLASGKFKTNALLLQVAMLSFNCLRIIGQSSLKMTKMLPRKFKVMRRRLKSVMQDLIYIACKRVRHAGSIILKIGNSNPWFEVFRQLHIKFA
jgi:hypothetical protein